MRSLLFQLPTLSTHGFCQVHFRACFAQRLALYLHPISTIASGDMRSKVLEAVFTSLFTFDESIHVYSIIRANVVLENRKL